MYGKYHSTWGTPMSLPWLTNQQVLIINNTNAPLGVGTSVTLQTYTRTSTGRLITRPRIVYSTNDTNIILTPLSNDSVRLTLRTFSVVSFSNITATWSTLGGDLRSTMALAMQKQNFDYLADNYFADAYFSAYFGTRKII
jgi:hypothetical protein